MAKFLLPVILTTSLFVSPTINAFSLKKSLYGLGTLASATTAAIALSEAYYQHKLVQDIAKSVPNKKDFITACGNIVTNSQNMSRGMIQALKQKLMDETFDAHNILTQEIKKRNLLLIIVCLGCMGFGYCIYKVLEKEKKAEIAS